MTRILLLLLFIGTPLFAGDPLGFLPPEREQLIKYEGIFLNTPTPDHAKRWMRKLTEEPHVAGTEEGKRSAEYVRDRLQEFGLKAELVEYHVYLNYPKKLLLRLIHPQEEELSLVEAGEIRDKDSFSKDAFPGFHGYGASGTASGQLVYVNYGTREDFDRLAELGISVTNKIVITRYGKVFRGLKVREAQERGAKGILIYSDPADDGYMKGDVYPDGPMRPESALQRGSVRFISEDSGDPSTPGWASLKNAKRLPNEKMRLATIPSLPLAYGEAQKILKAMAGPRVPDDWQGGLPFAYHLGPGPAEIKMEVEMDYGIHPIYNVMGWIEGSEEKDRWVILGNHRDAWTYGAVDPNSGTTAFLEAARGLGEAWKAGWRPRRTIAFASWDGEEYGLLGSTEWVEDKADELKQKAIAYINLDSAVPPPDWDVAGIPSLREVALQVASKVPEPRKGKTLLDAWMAREKQQWAKNAPVDLTHSDQAFEMKLDSLGSGSDYTGFVHHLGIACLDTGFAGPYGVYHSIYDNLFWMENFGDPEYLYHIAAARFYGLVAMRLASPSVVPLRYAPYVRHLQNELESIRRENVVAMRAYSPESKNKKPLEPDFNPLVKALDSFGAAANELDAALEKLEQGTVSSRIAQINDAVVQIERAFLDPSGLPGRSWFRHVFFAPGFTTGYAPWSFPGITQALKDRDPQLFEAELKRVLARIDAGVLKIREATDLAQL